MTSHPSLQNNPMVADWIAVDSDGTVRVRSGKVDLGQRISWSIAILAAEELAMDPAEILVEGRSTGTTPDEGITAGSNSMEQSGFAVRKAAATARHHILQLASDALGADATNLELDSGLVRENGTNRSITLADLVGGEPLDVPVDIDTECQSPKSYLRIGKSGIPVDLIQKTNGKARYVHDLARDGMWHARTVRPPHAHAALASLPDAACVSLRESGLDIFQDGSFIAVIGADEFAVINAAERLGAAIQWDRSVELDTTDIFLSLVENSCTSLPVVAGTPLKAPVPQIPDQPAAVAATLTATYERPYQVHGSIGPSAALAHVHDGQLEIWTHSQGIYPLREVLSQSFDMKSESILVHHVPGAGCYGHNGADDVAFEAALIARKFSGRPILLKWTRQEEHAWEPFAPAMAVKMQACIGSDGRVSYWSGESFSDTHTMRPRPNPDGTGQARFLANRFLANPIDTPAIVPNMANHGGIHRNLDPYYKFPDTRLVKHLVRDLPHRTSAMRCLGAVTNVFAIESFMDELADTAEVDPVSFRLQHLNDPRAKAVLNTAADGLAFRRNELGEGRGQGIAFARYKNAQAYAAVAVELNVDEAGSVHLDRAAIAADAGEIVDPDGLKAQLEGGFMQAASWALYEQVRHDRQGILTLDWESYPILRFDNVPEIDVTLIDRPGQISLGAGEASGGPSVAAIANAIYHAVGIRTRRMPFDPDAIRKAAFEMPD